MKVPMLATALLLATTLSAPVRADDAPPAALALGQRAPLSSTLLKNVDGKEITIASSAGRKGTLVFFICNHCPWVKAWQSRIAEVGNAAVGRGIGVIAINANDPDAYPEDAYDNMIQRAKDAGYHFAYAMDGTSNVARAFGASHTPEAFLFDAKGKLVYHGAIDDNAQHADEVKSHWLADAVTAVAAGKDVPTAQTKALGCGIKYRAMAAAQ
jgi:hypothetical protein